MTTSGAPIEYKRSKEDIERERKYAAEDAMRTLSRAEEIRKDTRLMNDVKKVAKEQMEAAKRFCK